MKRSRLIEVLRLFSTRERTKFKEYVYSPFFNKNKKVRKLCTYLLEYAPDFNHPDLEKRLVYQAIYEEKGFKELRINNVISDLLQLLYNYLAYQQYAKKGTALKIDLISELLDREIPGHIDRQAKRLGQDLEKNALRNYEYYYDRYMLHDRLDQHSLSQGSRGYDENLQLKSDMLDLYFYCNKLRIACDMMSRNIVVNAGYDCHFLADLRRYYEDNEYNFQDVPALQVYYKVLQMLEETTDATHYYEFKTLLGKHMGFFPQKELRILYNYALNYCVRQINYGQSIFYKEIFELYKLLLEQKIIFKNGYLTQWSYINIIAAGMRLKEYEWTEQFIYQYKEYLLPEEQHNVFTYNLAAYHFAKEDFNQALAELHNVEFTDAFYHLAAKMIQLKSYYELDETEPFFALVEASRKYIFRNRQLSDYQRQSYQNFFKIANRIYNLKIKKMALSNSEITSQKAQVLQFLQNPIPMGNKNWLEQVLQEI
jgi:hypothetical protein